MTYTSPQSSLRRIHPYGLSIEQSFEACAFYLSKEAQCELQLVLLRDFARDMGTVITPLPDMDRLPEFAPTVAFARFDHTQM
jgi:hypothetical protein